jgi:hypothetical protein
MFQLAPVRISVHKSQLFGSQKCISFCKKSDWFSEQQISIKFCVKLRNKAGDTCAMFSEAYGGEAMKKSSVLGWHKQFKEGYMSKSQYRQC